jgi:hypothetical protein
VGNSRVKEMAPTQADLYRAAKAAEKELSQYRPPPAQRAGLTPTEQAKVTLAAARGELRKVILGRLAERRLAAALEYVRLARLLVQAHDELMGHDLAIRNLSGNHAYLESFTMDLCLPAPPQALLPPGFRPVEGYGKTYIPGAVPGDHEQRGKSAGNRAYQIEMDARSDPELAGAWPFGSNT